MMINRSIFSLAAVVVCGLVCGCASQERRGARYGDPNGVISGAPDHLTMYDLESSVKALIDKMKEHPQFVKNYDAAKAAKKGKLPVVCLSLIDNNTSDPEVRSRGRATDDTIRVALFDSGLFVVKNDDEAHKIQSRIIWGADGGIENAAVLMKQFGKHLSPDFLVTGDIRQLDDVGGYHTYRLRIAVYNLHSGEIVWEGIQSKVKF